MGAPKSGAATISRPGPNEEPRRPAPTRNWTYEHTRVLPEVFEGLGGNATLNILDAGPVEAQTVDFLRRFRCRLYVADLFNCSFPAVSNDETQAFLETVDDVRFDVCLLWDFINFPDDSAFAGFISILNDHIHEKTRLYAIGAYSVELPIRPYRYAIADIDKLAIRPAAGTVPRPRSHEDVVRAMNRNVVESAALRQDNRLELMLSTIPATSL